MYICKMTKMLYRDRTASALPYCKRWEAGRGPGNKVTENLLHPSTLYGGREGPYSILLFCHSAILPFWSMHMYSL